MCPIHTARSPILVVGADRSGTTLLSLMLDAHSRVAIPYESHFFVRYHRGRARFGDLTERKNRLELIRSILSEPYVRRWDKQVSVDDVDLDRCDSIAGAIDQIYRSYARQSGKDIWGDKTPAHIEDLHVLNHLFPEAHFVHIVRDGRDVALSMIRQRWGPNDFMSALESWAQTVECARKMLRMLPEERFVEIRFEDLVKDPRRELAKVLQVVGLEFEPAMIEGYSARAEAKVGERIKDHHAHLMEKPSTGQAFKWIHTLSKADQAVAHEVAGSTLAGLGYPQGVTNHPLKILRKAVHRLRESYRWRFRK